MFITAGVIFAILWLIAMASSFTLGGYIHVLLALSVTLILISVFTGRRSL